MLDAAWHDDELAFVEVHGFLPELHLEAPAQDEEHLVLEVVEVPGEGTHEFDDLHGATARRRVRPRGARRGRGGRQRSPRETMVEPIDEGALERYLHLMSECAKDQDWAVHHPEWMTHLHRLWDDLTLDEKRFVNASDGTAKLK